MEFPQWRTSYAPSFPEKLYYCLAKAERDNQSHIVSWQHHGRSFKVHKREEFTRTILPQWFRQSTFASFQRQLNVYGFVRIVSGPDYNAYYNDKFLRGQPALCHGIQRRGGASANRSPRSLRAAMLSREPNLDQLPPMPPHDPTLDIAYFPSLNIPESRIDHSNRLCFLTEAAALGAPRHRLIPMVNSASTQQGLCGLAEATGNQRDTGQSSTVRPLTALEQESLLRAWSTRTAPATGNPLSNIASLRSASMRSAVSTLSRAALASSPLSSTSLGATVIRVAREREQRRRQDEALLQLGQASSSSLPSTVQPWTLVYQQMLAQQARDSNECEEQTVTATTQPQEPASPTVHQPFSLSSLYLELLRRNQPQEKVLENAHST